MVRVPKRMRLLSRGFKTRRMMVIALALLAIILSVAGCSSNSEPIRATWIDIKASGDTVSIPVSAVSNNKMTHFLLGQGPSGEIAFMAYELDRKIYVRSNMCVPCRSLSFSLQKDILVCDTCVTQFKAKTGDGIKGVTACMGFPKASVPYEIRDNTIVMKRNDLITAYQNTLKPGWP